MAAKKKEVDLVENIMDEMNRSQTFNPLLNALRENDKKHLFKTNVTTVFHKTGYALFDYYFGSVINIHDDLGKIIKQEPRVGQAAGTFNLIIGNSGSGKAQPVSTKIPTPEGYTLMGNLKVGDQVFDSLGRPTTVTGVYPQGEKDIYEITFSDGRTSLCCEDHLWKVWYVKNDIDECKVLQLKDIIKDYKNFDNPLDTYRKYCIETLGVPVQYKHRDLPIHPYVLGVLLAGGYFTEEDLYLLDPNKTSTANISGLTGLKYLREGLISKFCKSDSVGYISTKEFFKDLPEMIGLNNSDKYIPEDYLYNDYEGRIMLLQGLMDTSGDIVCNNDKYDVTFSSCSKRLLEDIQQLIQSIGYNGEIIPNKVDDRNGYYSSILFIVPNSFKTECFSCVDKLSIAMKASEICNDNKYEALTIDEIKFHHREEAQCIIVDSEDHLYVTENFIVTHNTTLASQIAANIIRQYKYANTIHYDCENRFDISRCETITHLPASFFDDSNGPERYMIKTGLVGLDVIQEMIVKTYVSKMRLKKEMMVNSGFQNEFGKEVMVMEPTVIIIDSITSVINETFNVENNKEASDAEKMRGNTEGARDAKTLKGFFKDILPLCKEANIIIYGINHINNNMSMNAFIPVAKQQNYLKQDESIPGGKTMIYYPFNIIKLTARPSDDFTEESDGFAGHMVMVEPIKSSSNQSGNNSKGVSFEMVFSFKYGFDALRTMIMYGKEIGAIEGNKTRMKFKEDDSFTFNLKNIMQEKSEKPIWESLRKFVFPHLTTHLSFIEPAEVEFDQNTLDY